MMQNNPFICQTASTSETSSSRNKTGSSFVINPINDRFTQSDGVSTISVPETMSMPTLKKRPDNATSGYQHFRLQPLNSRMNIGGNVIHVAPDKMTVEEQSESQSLTRPTINTAFPGYVQQPITMQIPVNPASGPMIPGVYPITSGAPVAGMVPLQNIDPETAKTMLGQLVQVLQQAGQLPQNEALQQLVQMSSGQTKNPMVKSESSETQSRKKSKLRGPERQRQAQAQGKKIVKIRGVKFTGELGMRESETQHRGVFKHKISPINVRDTNMSLTDCLDASPVRVKSEVFDDSYDRVSSPYRKKYDLHPCEVKLRKLVIRRDNSGKIILPKSPLTSRVDVRKLVEVKRVKPRPKQKQLGTLAKDGESLVYNVAASFPDSIKVILSPNMNEARDHSVRTMYMGPTEDIMQWLTIVWWRNSHFCCQCVFCPMMAESPKTIVKHLREDHPELVFALNKKDLLGKSFLFINCRHCDFVTVDPVILWIHFELHHGIMGILDGGLHPDINLSVKAELNEISSSSVITEPTSYVCFDCFKVSVDSKALAMHVLQDHKDTLNYNGCFVKLMMIQKPVDRLDVTYHQAIVDTALADSRFDIFICMLCDLCVKCPYTVLSHTLNSHQNKYLLYVCSLCSYNSIVEERMIEHMTSVHDTDSRLLCSSTVISERKGHFAEIAVRQNRKAFLSYHSASTTSNARNVRESEGKMNGVAKKKQKTGIIRSRTVVRNGIQTATNGNSYREENVVQNGEYEVLQSKAVSSSQRAKATAKRSRDVAGENPCMAFSGLSPGMRIKEEMISSDSETECNLTGGVTEEIDYKITLAEEEVLSDLDDDQEVQRSGPEDE